MQMESSNHNPHTGTLLNKIYDLLFASAAEQVLKTGYMHGPFATSAYRIIAAQSPLSPD